LKKALIFILLMLLPITGFGLDDSKNIYNNPDIPVEVQPGDEFSIVLPSNPTTGYKWELLKPVDDDILELQDTEYTSKCKDGLIGCGGVEVWNFFAASEGETTISLKYARPWEKDVKPVQIRVFRVIVNP
jgi:predicted secreted protein